MPLKINTTLRHKLYYTNSLVLITMNDHQQMSVNATAMYGCVLWQKLPLCLVGKKKKRFNSMLCENKKLKLEEKSC